MTALTAEPIEPAAPQRPITCERCGQAHKRCTGHKRLVADDGSVTLRPCGNWPVRGATVCRSHGGGSPRVKAAAQRRLAEQQAAKSLADVGVTPIANPLDELAEVTAEARAWQQQVAAMVSELGTNWAAWSENGEQLRAIVPLFERALDRCGKLLADWVRLGFDERMVTLHERQAELVAQVIRAVLEDPELGLSVEQQEKAPAVTRRHLELVAS